MGGGHGVEGMDTGQWIGLTAFDVATVQVVETVSPALGWRRHAACSSCRRRTVAGDDGR
jgi:hypothetical protein